jgi:hypothetical protein
MVIGASLTLIYSENLGNAQSTNVQSVVLLVAGYVNQVNGLSTELNIFNISAEAMVRTREL